MNFRSIIKAVADFYSRDRVLSSSHMVLMIMGKSGWLVARGLTRLIPLGHRKLRYFDNFVHFPLLKMVHRRAWVRRHQLVVPWRFASSFENYEGGWPSTIARDLGPGKVFIDVGACVGSYTVFAAKSGAKTIAIEPWPFNFSLLKEVVRRNGVTNDVYLVNCAISDCKETIKLRGLRGFNGRAGPYTSEYELELEIRCMTIDELVSKLKLRRVDWIKIDVDGTEVSVLKGAIKTLKKFRPKILVEVCEVNAEKIKRLFRQLSYTVRPVHYVGWDASLGSVWNWLSTPSSDSNCSGAMPE